MRLLALFVPLAILTACEEPMSKAEEARLVDEAMAEINRLQATVNALEAAAEQREQRQAVAAREAAAEPVPEPKPADLCWQDYCPCEPPQGGPDEFVCRRLRAGLHVDEEQLSLAAGMRDARQQMADWEAEYGGFE